MTDLPSPATCLRDVVVVHEQSGTVWRPGRARIRGGRIVVSATGAPGGFFDHSTATFRIEAIDGANRVRRFPDLVLVARHAKEYVFD